MSEALKRGAEVYKNISATGKTDLVLQYKGETLHVDVKMMKFCKVQQSYKSYGNRKAIVFRVLVNPDTWECRWVMRKEPKGWETFWS